MKMQSCRISVWVACVVVMFGLWCVIPSALLAEECKDSSGAVMDTQPVEGISICATETGGKGDVAPFGSPDGRLDISDAVVTVQMFMQLLDNVETSYMAKADLAPLCTQETKESGDCSSNGNGNVDISDAVVIVRLAMKLEENVISSGDIIEMLFNLAGVTSVQALQTNVTEAPSNDRTRIGRSGRPLFTYRVSTDNSEGTNLLGVNAEGNQTIALDAGGAPVHVMYTRSSPQIGIDPTTPGLEPDKAAEYEQTYVPAGKYLYVALDPHKSIKVMQDEPNIPNCAFIKVEVATNAKTCVKTGVYLSEIDNVYRKLMGGKVKPVQFDNDGNLYFSGIAFTLSDGQIVDQDDGMVKIFRYTVDGTAGDPITNDLEKITGFKVMGTGELIYKAVNQLNGIESMYMVNADNSVINVQGNTVTVFDTDTYKSAFWVGNDENSKPGIHFLRPMTDASGNAITNKTVMNTYRDPFDRDNDGATGEAPRQLIIGDDFKLYAVYYDISNAGTGVQVNRVLPFDGEAMASFTAPSGGSDLRFDTSAQVARGYLYYVQSQDNRDGLGVQDVILAVDLTTRSTKTMLLKGRYEVYAWTVSGNRIYFSGRDMQNNTNIAGEVNTLKMRTGRSGEAIDKWSVASPLEEAYRVMDIEVITPQQPTLDPGGNFVVSQFNGSADTRDSISIEFSKYANKALVEKNLTLTSSENASEPIPMSMIWFYKALHLIPDTDGWNGGSFGGLLDSGHSTPLASNAEGNISYTVKITSESGPDLVLDAYDAFDLKDGTSNGLTRTFSPVISEASVNTAPTASFTASVDDAGVLSIINSSSDPEGDTLTYSWSLGDGNSSIDQIPTHTYTESDTYHIALTVTDPAGLHTMASQDVTVVVPDIHDGEQPGTDPLPRGDLSFSLVWSWTDSFSTEGPDIDIWVTDPTGGTLTTSRTEHSMGPSPLGGLIDFDDQGGTGPGDGGGPERVFWPTGASLDGTYAFGVRYYDGNGTASYTISIYEGDTKVKEETGVVSTASENRETGFSFTYPSLTDGSVGD